MSKLKTASMTQIMNLSSVKGSDLTYKDLKIECIIRKMPFDEVLKADFFRLSNYLLTNVLVHKDESLLDAFDDYMDDILHERGADELIHDSLRLGYVKREEGDEPIKKVIKEKVEKKPPRTKDSNGLFKGTMKSYTYELQGRGKTVEQTIVKVQRKFPASKPKSIKIWFNKAKKQK